MGVKLKSEKTDDNLFSKHKITMQEVTQWVPFKIGSLVFQIPVSAIFSGPRAIYSFMTLPCH